MKLDLLTGIFDGPAGSAKWFRNGNIEDSTNFMTDKDERCGPDEWCTPPSSCGPGDGDCWPAQCTPRRSPCDPCNP